jgi:hypothetical protein|tara:strand:- start:4194 stop:4805 length:612 start_codon:yes stop_codon:yes gene_type:complete
MPDPRLIAYVKQNLQLGYTEEQLRKTLVSAGYNVRIIDDAIDTVLRPQELKPIQPAPAQEEQQSGFFDRVPIWMVASAIGGVFLLVIIIVLILPSGSGPSGLMSQEGIKISAYDFSCAGPASSLTITVKNERDETISDIQLFKGDAFQQGQLISSLESGASSIYSYESINCMDWLGEKTIKIVSNKATAEGSIKFTCSSGACT